MSDYESIKNEYVKALFNIRNPLKDADELFGEKVKKDFVDLGIKVEEKNEQGIDKALLLKNEFVRCLREELEEVLETKSHITYGQGDFEGAKVGRGYVYRKRQGPEDLGGFAFFKDKLPTFMSKERIYGFILSYVGTKSIANKPNTDDLKLKIKFENTIYTLDIWWPDTYAGEVKIKIYKDFFQ